MKTPRERLESLCTSQLEVARIAVLELTQARALAALASTAILSPGYFKSVIDAARIKEEIDKRRVALIQKLMGEKTEELLSALPPAPAAPVESAPAAPN